MILEEEGESWGFAGDGGVPGLGKADRGPGRERILMSCSMTHCLYITPSAH